MTRLLTTVAFSALILGVAAPLARAADTPSTSPGMSATQNPQGSAAAAPSGKSAQTSPSTATGTGMGSSTQAAPAKQTMSSSAPPSSTTSTNPAVSPTTTASNTAAAEPHAVHRSAWRRADHSANELNRQELSQITGSSASSYGSSR